MAKRWAIYTRKSTEDGLEQGFNSLDTQREACGAYASEGREAVSEIYDDGGWSGGNMERPALQHLPGDVKAGKVDIIIVYDEGNGSKKFQSLCKSTKTTGQKSQGK